MRNFVKTLIKNGIGKSGDKMNEHVSPVVLYQPKACKRGEILKQIEGNGEENKSKKSR